MITDVTSKVDLPTRADRGSEQTEGADKRPSAARKPSEPDNAVRTSVDRSTLNKAVAKVGEAIRKSDSRLQIDIDPDLERVVVQVIDRDTGEVIRQIPAEELLELAKNIQGQKGLLLEEQA